MKKGDYIYIKNRLDEIMKCTDNLKSKRDYEYLSCLIVDPIFLIKIRTKNVLIDDLYKYLVDVYQYLQTLYNNYNYELLCPLVGMLKLIINEQIKKRKETIQKQSRKTSRR